MSLLDEYKKRQKENKQVTNNNLLYELKQRKAFETQKDIISRINSWNNNSSAFMNEFKNRFYDKDGNYIDSFRSDTNDALIKANIQKKYLDTERESLSKILKEYESFYDENWVKNIRLQLANGHLGQDKIIESYVSNNNLFSQFENADEFDKWSEQQKKDEELRKTDLNYTKNQITVLELDFERMQNLRNKESELFSELSTKEYALKEQNRRADLTVDPKLKKEVETLRAELETTKAEYAQLSTTLGNADDIASRLNSLRDTYEQAKEFQETEALATDALADSDFLQIAQKGSEWGNDTTFEFYGKDKDRGTYGFFNREKNDLISYYRNNLSSYEDEAEDMPNGPTKEMEKAYHFAKEMTEDEYNIYAYYLGKGDTDSAQKYLDSIEQSITYRFAENFYEQNLKDANIFEQIIFGFSAGTEQFQTGLENLISDETEYDSSYRQLISGKVQEDLKDSTFGKVAYDLSVTTGNMLPSILASTAIGLINPVAGNTVGTALMGASAKGNAYAEMINLGYTKEQASNYSTLVGASEAGLQYLLGGIGKLGGSVSSKAISSAVSKIDNVFARTAIQLGGSMLSEGAEEYLQEVLDPFFKNIAFGEDNDIRFISEEALYSGLLGALSAGVLEGGSTVGGNVSTYRKGKQIKAAGVTAEQLSELGSKLSVDSEAYKLAGRINEETGAYTIGRMFNELNTEITAQNKAEIKEALRAKGINPVSANSIANWMERVVAGEELTSKQKAALENNPVLGEVMRDVLYERNTTALQRQAGLDSIRSQLEEYQIKQALDKAVKKAEKKKAKNTANNTADTQDVQNTAQQAEMEDFETEADTSLAESEKANEANPRVSDNGRTFSTKTGEDLDIVGIASTKDKTFKTADGQTVDSKDVSFATENEAVLFDSVLSMDLPTEIANAIIDGYIPSNNISVTDYLLGSNLAYRYGYAGAKDIELMLDTDVRNIPEHLSKGLYNLGRETAKAEISKEQAEIDSKKAQKSENKAKKKGRVTFDGKELSKEFEDSLTDIQRESLKGIKVIAEVLGNDVNLFASYIAKEGAYKGKRVYKDSNGNVKLAPNGFYNPDGSINLDINSGNLGEGTMLYTLSHELTHHIRKWSPAKFKVLADFVVEQYNDNGIKINDLVYEQMAKAKKNGKSISYGTAYEEVIADACSTMLLDSNAIEKLAQKDKTLFEKIKSFIKDFIDKINKLYKNFSPDAKEAQYVKDIKGTTDKLQALWFEGLEDASESYKSAEITLAENGIAVNSDTESASLLSVRDVLSDDQRKKVSTALATRFGVTQQEAMDWLKAETSMASLILNPKYSQYLDYTPDPNEVAIKQNSDYPQGTVDFSPICAKRREFTSVMNNILRLFPNHVFAATDLAKIRSIMSEEGMTIPCGICYVEDRRQLDTIVAQNFIDSLKLYREGSKTRPDGKAFNTNQLKALGLIASESYTPSVYELVSLEGLNILKEKNPNMAEAWVKFNNARGMQSVRLLANEAEYKRQILKYTEKTVKSKNDKGGLRVYSFSDAEMFHLIDIIQVITDSATVGLSLQGYTKVNEYARAVKDTGEKLNRSLIPKGELGYHIEDGKVILDYDTVEGIDINHPDFFDNRNNPDVGNITIGVSDVQIRAAMVSDFVDQIIPFHTGQSEEVLGEKGIATWTNYKDFQTEKDIATEQKSDHQINIYTEVLQVLEKEGKTITKKTFVEKFLQVCKENNLIPRFSQFLNVNENGEYVYTEGYHKFLVDFKTFAQTKVGEYLPQKPVKPIFDNGYITKIMKNYVKTQKVKNAEVAGNMPKVIERITNEIVKPNERKFSDRDSLGNELSKKQQEFFKDSKVRDADGNLMVMYHGTANGGAFTIFDGDRLGNEARKTQIGQGFYFTNMKNEAEAYMKNVDIYGKVGKGSNPHLHQVYLNITNPFDINADQLDMQSVKAVYSEGTYDYFFSNWIPFYLNKKTVNGKMVTKAEIQAMSKSEKVSAYVDYLASLGTKEVLSNMVRAFPSEKQSELLSSMKKHLGYDGIVEEFSKGKYQYVAFSSEQVKSTDNTAPTSDPDIRYSDRDLAPTFYSYMGKVVDEIKPAKMGASGVVSYLKGKGVKNEEIKWSGIETFLEGKKSVTKQELQEFVASSQLQIEEQTSQKQYDLRYDSNTRTYTAYGLDGTVIDTYTYSEFLGGYVADSDEEIYSVEEIEEGLAEALPEGQPRWSRYKLDGGENYREIVFTMPNSSYSNQMMRTHWGGDAEGVLVHARIQDFDINGKKMLFVEEIQSDWHNEGHKEGYIDKTKEITTKTTTVKHEDGAYRLYRGDRELYAHISDTVLEQRFPNGITKEQIHQGLVDEQNRKLQDAGAIPDAPFRDNYQEYVLKRLLRMAAENGYDSIGWTPAEIQSKRWSDDYAEGYRIEYDQDIPKFLRKYGKQWGATVGTETIGGNEVWSMDITDSMKNSVLYEGQTLYFDRNPDGGFSNRYLLANALESTAKTAEDKKKLVEYKAKLGKLSEVQQRLQAVNAKIKEISFSKGKRDKVKLAELQKTSKELNDLINRYDKKLFDLESTESLKRVLEREKKAAYKKAAQKGREALADYREKAKQREQDIRTKYQESRQKSIEGREKTAMRHKIQKVIMELDGMLRHGTKEKNVKVGLQKVVADAVQAINADTVKLEALRKAYADIRYGKSENVPAYYMEEAAQIEQKIDEVIDLVGDTPMSKMSLEQLNSVYNMYRMVLTTVRNVNKVFRENKLEDLRVNAEAVMVEESKLPKLKEERSKAIETVRKYMWNEMIPVYAFETLGSNTLKKFFWDTVEAQNVFARDVDEANAVAKNARQKYGYKTWDRSKIYEFTLEDGKVMRMNLEHMMSVYAYSKRKQAISHMTTGGFFFNDDATFRKKGGLISLISSQEEGYKVSAETLAKIKDKMSEVAKGSIEYVDEMQSYLTDMGEKGNEVSRVIWGIDIFKEKVYFPLKSVKDFVFQTNQPTQETSLKNDGMTKETKPNASNPIVLDSFDDIWASHVNRMSQYHAFVIPIDNLNKVYNYGTWLGDNSKSVSTIIGSRHGKAANEYLTQFIQDLNGGISVKGASNPLMNMFGKFKKTAVAASTSVVVQQPTAILRATAMIDPKYFVGKPNVHMLKQYEQLKKYAPIAIIKEIGGFDAGAGRQATNWLNDDTKQGIDKALQKIDDISMLGAAWGDILGWCTIWDAVKREVKANNKGMDVNSEEFLNLAGKRFTEVIVYTQVYDSTLSRSGYMRSKHDSVKMLTAFMGEPTVSVNMMYNAILQAKRGGKGTVRKAARTIGAVYLSQIAASAAASAIYALRDDDEEETYMEKFAEAWSDKMLGKYGLTGELNPLTQLPAVKDIISIFEGWDVERTDIAVIKDIKDAFDGLFSDNKSTWRKIEDFSGAIASLFGLPVKNILRTGREMYNAVNAIFSDVEGGSFGEAFVRGMTDEKKSKPNKLYDAIVNGDEETLKILREGYDDDTAYETAVKKALRENDPRIKEAAEAGYNGDVAERVRIAKEIIAEGNFSQDIVVEAINAEVNAIKKELDSEEGETEDVEEKKSIYSTKDISTALEDGDATLAKEIIADIVSVKVENYMAKDEDLKQKEAEKKAKTSVKSSLSEYWKKLYVEAYKAKDTDEMKRIRFVLKDTGLYGTANDIISTCNNWVKESRKK